MASQADFLDVIAGKLNPGCTMDKYLQIVQDFRDQWASERDYTVEILFPAQSRDLNSVPAKLMARFRECTTTESRASFFIR